MGYPMIGVERRVMVLNQPQLINVRQRSKSAWIAVGDYHGTRIEITARTESSAAEHWRRAAYHANAKAPPSSNVIREVDGGPSEEPA